MKELLTSFLLSILANITTDSAKNAISALRGCKTTHEEINAVNVAKGIIEMAAANGEISLDGAQLEAVHSIQCDHGTGQIFINQTLLKADVLLTGGLKADSAGSTLISESTLQSCGTTISIGSDAYIKITGDATIHQS